MKDQTSMFVWVDYDGAILDIFASRINVKLGAAVLARTGSLSDVVGAQACLVPVLCFCRNDRGTGWFSGPENRWKPIRFPIQPDQPLIVMGSGARI